MIFLQRANGGASLSYIGNSARILKNGSTVIDWTSGGVVNGIPEGDGYTVEIRTGTAVKSDTLAVGAVIWTLGQSNMKGWFQTPSLAAMDSSHAYMFAAGQWNTLQGDGATAFASDLSATLSGTPVAFVDASVNGSALFASNDGGFGYWEAGSASLYAAALQMLKSAGGKAELVLWTQGEADAGGVTAAQYQSGLTALFSRIQADDPVSDILIAGLGPARLSGQESGYTAIRNGQAATAAAMSHTYYVPTDLDLDLSDGPHLTGASRAWQAREVAAVAGWLNGASSSTPVELIGGGTGDVITGTAGADMIAGYTGNDTLSGAQGNDLIRGGTGADAVSGDDGNDLLSGGADADVIDGGAGNDEIYGDAGDDTVYGGNGDDLIFGGAGINWLSGGAGNDTLVINAGDTVVEAADSGVDTVQIAENYTLGDNVENLVLLGSAVSGTGNALNNKLTGDAMANQLSGLEGDDVILGMEGADTLLGGAGNDTLDGGSGADTMIGDIGDDSYIVDNFGDTVRESLGGGIDAIKVSLLSYTLPDNVENLRFGGSGAFTGTGNALANVIQGGGSYDVLNGGGGDDQIYGDVGNDTLDGGTGADVMYGGSGSDTYTVDNAGDHVNEDIVGSSGGADLVNSSVDFVLGANVENLTLTGMSAINATGNDLANKLTGNSTDNVLYGLGGNDALNGGTGADTMYGGAGNDTYTVDNIGDMAVELANQGIDRVISSVTYTLADNVENLTLSRSAALSGTGNSLANVLLGNAGANALDGKLGADTLTGGAGNDTFVFSTALGSGNVDRITDFVAVDDTIQLDASVFVGLTAGALTASAFKDLSTGELDGDDHILYDRNTGILSYDTDGSGSGAAVQFAILDNKITITAAGLVVTGTDTVGGTDGTGGTVSATTGNDTLTGTSGNDLLDGKEGADSLRGLAGNDIYVVDNVGDTVTEMLNEGTDTVRTSLTSYTLGANVETLTYTGTAAFTGTGNELAKAITGSSGADKLDGKAGADTLMGGAGNDTYTIDNTGDMVVELANQGTDRVISQVSYVLSDNVENLTLSTSAALSGTGNSLVNVLVGNGGANVLDGRGGADTLTGGSGNDTFVFRFGETQGDKVLDFTGAGVSAGDGLTFYGFGSGATLAQVGTSDSYTITADTAHGGASETFQLVGVTNLDLLTGSGHNDIMLFA